MCFDFTGDRPRRWPRQETLRSSVRQPLARVLVEVGERVRNAGPLLQERGGCQLRRRGLGHSVHALRSIARQAEIIPSTVLNVGARVGQFARLVAAGFPKAAVHSFEPLPESFADLRSVYRASGPRAHAYRLALGRITGTLDMGLNELSAASSAYDVTSLCMQEFPSHRCHRLERRGRGAAAGRLGRQGRYSAGRCS